MKDRKYVRGYTDALKDISRIIAGEHPDFPEVRPSPGGDLDEWRIEEALVRLRKRVKE